MKRTLRRAALSHLALAALLAAGCDDSGVTAPSDGSIDVRANPGTIVIDPNLNQTQGSSTITARVLDAGGVALEGVSVFFSTSGGTLASADPSTGGSRAVKTNANGAATDTLTVGTLGPTSIDVVAVSGSLEGTVEITKQVGPVNLPPVADVALSPSTQQAVDRAVLFDGSGSDDPDGDPITMYRWTISSTNPDDPARNPLVIEGQAENAFSLSFAGVQNLSGTLQVTDDPLAPQRKAQGDPISYRASAPFSYRIVQVLCSENAAPVARIAGPTTVQLAPGDVDIELDGSLSSDADGTLTRFVWACGNGDAPVLSNGGVQATCTYAPGAAPTTYQATLSVEDDGTGFFDPVTIDWECKKNSVQASVNVVVSPAP